MLTIAGGVVLGIIGFIALCVAAKIAAATVQETGGGCLWVIIAFVGLMLYCYSTGEHW